MSHADVVRELDRIRSEKRIGATGRNSAASPRSLAEADEWGRIERLLAGTGGVYDVNADPIVRAERVAQIDLLVAREERKKKREEERTYDFLAHVRIYALQVMEEAGFLEEGLGESLGAEGPLILFDAGDLRAWRHVSERTRHTSASLEELIPLSVQDPADFAPSVRAHSALLTAMALMGPLKEVDPASVVRLAQADPEAVLSLAAWVSAVDRR
ncbi:hypothetical protein ACICHK_42650 (plasmid) [Streptomyces sp. AHU1]|uniref:hypothetical protein n=1 Tax=Streptomyces sp. AHU1 TaxID=3377215 RepID=UPI003877D0B7